MTFQTMGQYRAALLKAIDAAAAAAGVLVYYSFRCYSCGHEWEATTPEDDCPQPGCGTTNSHCAENPEPAHGVEGRKP
jgi:rubrerythrin